MRRVRRQARWPHGGPFYTGARVVPGGGAAYVGWEGTYSLNFSGRRVPVESVHGMTFPQAPLTGQLDFTAAGSGLFESPQRRVVVDRSSAL